MDLDFIKITYQEIAAHRNSYLRSMTAALDGMWENAFFPKADHWAITHNQKSIGFCTVNTNGKMLGFNTSDLAERRTVFAQCIEKLGISGAFVSTAEPTYLSLCSDHQSSISVNALMYVENENERIAPETPSNMNIRIAVSNDLEAAISFGVAAIQADRDWLAGYFEERIRKNELFVLWSRNELIATGECRISPNQDNIADVGMIVGPAHRKKGLGTFMLHYLRSIGAQKGLNLICSTESSNIGAQKAIERAGFVSGHRILEFIF